MEKKSSFFRRIVISTLTVRQARGTFNSLPINLFQIHELVPVREPQLFVGGRRLFGDTVAPVYASDNEARKIAMVNDGRVDY